jgi:hypothetical protein
VYGNHHGQPIRPNMPNGQFEAGKLIRDWLRRKDFSPF